MPIHKPQVAIVIPNYNGLDFLRHCLQTLEQQAYASFLITVVDNGSVDGSAAFIRNRYPKVQLISLPENRGFSAAVNAGIVTTDSPYIFLLNNDTELPSDCLFHLVQAAEALPDYDFFAPKMLSYHDHDVLDGAGDGFLRGGAGYRIGTMEQDSSLYDQSGPVFGACGGAVLYRRALFDKIGYLDDNFFAYLEDVDLNLRANRAGLRCWYVPEARVYHIGSATTGSKFNDFTIRLSTRNSFFVLLKNYHLSLFLRFFPVICIYQFFWLLFVIKKHQLRPYMKGIIEAVGKISLMREEYRQSRELDHKTTAELAECLTKTERSVVDSIMRRRQEKGRGNRLLLLYRFLFL